jgi:hypothetical protein
VKKIAALMMFLTGASGLALAAAVTAPEIGATSAVSALALLSGGLLVLRGRQRSKK